MQGLSILFALNSKEILVNNNVFLKLFLSSHPLLMWVQRRLLSSYGTVSEDENKAGAPLKNLGEVGT